MRVEGRIGHPDPGPWKGVAALGSRGNRGGVGMKSALEPLQSSALLTPCLWLSGPDLGLLTSRTLREYISVVLCHFICGSLWQPLQETITARILCNRFSIGNLETVASSYDRIWASFSALLLTPSSFSISNLFFRWESSDSEKLKKFPYLCYSQIFFFFSGQKRAFVILLNVPLCTFQL